MQKSFPLFLRKLQQPKKPFGETDILKTLSKDDFEELKNLGLLKRASDLTHITCESCDDPHSIPVRCEGEKAYVSCISDSMPNYLEPHSIRTWEFDVFELLQRMTARLGLSEQIEQQDLDGLWHLGVIMKDDLPHTCYFYHGKNLEAVAETLKEQAHGIGRQIVLTSRRCVLENPKDFGVLTLEVGLLVQLKGGELKFNKKVFDQYLNGFRAVQFEPSTGVLKVNGEHITTITPKTAQNYFASFLWEKFCKPRSYEEIEAFIVKKKRHKYSYTASQLCYHMKRKIKESVKKGASAERKIEMLDAIFETSTNEEGQGSFTMKDLT